MALGFARGSALVPAFTASRTLSRIGLQASWLLNSAILPEFTAAHARDNRSRQGAMFLVTLLTTLMIAVPLALFIACYGAQFVNLWSRGVIRPATPLMVAIATSSFFAAIWNPVANLFLAMNRQREFAYWFLGISIAAVMLAYILALPLGSAGPALAMAACDLLMTVVIARICLNRFLSWDMLWSGLGRVVAKGSELRARWQLPR